MTLTELVRIALSKPQLSTAIKTALVVGTILNIINQWQGLTGQAPINFWQLGLTYLVPFCVATYAGVKGRMGCD